MNITTKKRNQTKCNLNMKTIIQIIACMQIFKLALLFYGFQQTKLLLIKNNQILDWAHSYFYQLFDVIEHNRRLIAIYFPISCSFSTRFFPSFTFGPLSISLFFLLSVYLRLSVFLLSLFLRPPSPVLTLAALSLTFNIVFYSIENM